MFKLCKPISVKILSKKFDFKWSADDVQIIGIIPYDNKKAGYLTFTTKHYDCEHVEEGVVIAKSSNSSNVIPSSRPRDLFCEILSYLKHEIGFVNNYPHQIDESAKISSLAKIDEGVIIEKNVIIEDFVSIKKGVHIKKGTHIRAFSTLGDDGFGFGKSLQDIPIRFEHLGGLVIGEDCEVGCFTTIHKGTLSDTVLGKNVKVDAHVHIAHNCHIDDNCVITAGAIISGGVILKSNSWLGPNSAIIQKTVISENSLVGIGSVVIRNVEANSIVAGSPAKFIKKNN